MPSKWFFAFTFCRFLYHCEPALLCIVGELAGWGSVTAAVGVRYMRQLTGDTQHMTNDMWHMTHDAWLVTLDAWFLFFFPICSFLSVLVLVLLQGLSKWGFLCKWRFNNINTNFSLDFEQNNKFYKNRVCDILYVTYCHTVILSHTVCHITFPLPVGEIWAHMAKFYWQNSGF